MDLLKIWRLEVEMRMELAICSQTAPDGWVVAETVDQAIIAVARLHPDADEPQMHRKSFQRVFSCQQ